MKKFLSLCFSLAFVGSLAAQSSVPSQELDGVYITSISPNGQWIIGQADGEGFLYIRDLVNDQKYMAGGNLSEDGTGYVSGLGRTIANDGTAIALINGLPYYWTVASKEWKRLPGQAADGSVALGSITPDASFIVGSIGGTGLSTEDILVTNPCVWTRKDNGTYGAPEYLPVPAKDLFGRVPMYLNLISVSDDGKTIAAMMTEWSGFYEIPFIYTQDAEGNWSYSDIGSKLVNPQGLVAPKTPDYFDMDGPNPWDFLDEEQTDAFWNAFPAWLNTPEISSLTDEEQARAQLTFMAEFMSDEDKEDYLKALEEYLIAYDEFKAEEKAYNEFLQELRETGTNFVMNNAMISPDGKYAYFTGERTIISDPNQGEGGISHATSPVRVDVATGEAYWYESEYNLQMVSVAEDYSALCRIITGDEYENTSGWIFPGLSNEGMTIPEFVALTDETSYKWMENNMYREVIVGVTDQGAYQYDDAWTVGAPYCTPDLSLIACGSHTLFWADLPSGNPDMVSFIINTGMDVNGIDNITEVEDEVVTVEVYNLSGIRLFSGSSVPSLPSGLYIVKSTRASGTTTSAKVRL